MRSTIILLLLIIVGTLLGGWLGVLIAAMAVVCGYIAAAALVMLTAQHGFDRYTSRRVAAVLFHELVVKGMTGGAEPAAAFLSTSSRTMQALGRLKSSPAYWRLATFVEWLGPLPCYPALWTMSGAAL